jgi:hypothetical protein
LLPVIVLVLLFVVDAFVLEKYLKGFFVVCSVELMVQSLSFVVVVVVVLG